MSSVTTLMGAGVRADGRQALVADEDGDVGLTLVSFGVSASIHLPPYAARHLAERLILKAAEVERMAALTDELPCVPRPVPEPDAIAPMG